MNKAEFQKQLLAYTHNLLLQTQYASSDQSTQLIYQMGVLLGLLTELADADNYNYKRILYRVHPELKPQPKRG